MKFILIIFIFIQCSCTKRDKIYEYRIDNSFSGACALFITDSKKQKDTSNSLLIKESISNINKEKSNLDNIFISANDNNILRVVPIGKHNEVLDSVRYIFGLVKGFSKSSCNNHKNIEMLTFYVGYKNEYMTWKQHYVSTLDYFNSINIDWCSYYDKIK